MERQTVAPGTVDYRKVTARVRIIDKFKTVVEG
jgi:hypothetical protein